MSDILSLEDFQIDTLSLTEHILRVAQEKNTINREMSMAIRCEIFPLISDYLLEEGYLYSESFHTLKTLIDDVFKEFPAVINQDYFFSQKDIDDGLEAYRGTAMFKGLAKRIKWGVKWNEYSRQYDNREPNSDLLAKELYRNIIFFLDKNDVATFQSQKLFENLETADHSHNKKIIFYNAKRLAALVRANPGAFYMGNQNDETVLDNPKDTADTEDKNKEAAEDTSADTVSDIIKNVAKVISEAKKYRDVVRHSRMNIPKDIPETNDDRSNQQTLSFDSVVIDESDKKDATVSSPKKMKRS